MTKETEGGGIKKLFYLRLIVLGRVVKACPLFIYLVRINF